MIRNPLNFLDNALVRFDQALRTCVPGSRLSQRLSPASSLDQPELSETERQHAAGLMRINHTGEVCAQALYAGQASTAKLEQVRKSMDEAAAEHARLARMSGREREGLARRRFARFAARFQPDAVLRRAGVHAMMVGHQTMSVST